MANYLKISEFSKCKLNPIICTSQKAKVNTNTQSWYGSIRHRNISTIIDRNCYFFGRIEAVSKALRYP